MPLQAINGQVAAESHKLQNEPKFAASAVNFGSSVYTWIIGTGKQIINRNIVIIGKHYQRGIVCLTFTVFISAYAALGHVQIHCNFQLRKFSAFPHLFQPYCSHKCSQLQVLFLSRGDLYYVLIKHFKLIAFDFSIVMAGLNAFNRLAELKG